MSRLTKKKTFCTQIFPFCQLIFIPKVKANMVKKVVKLGQFLLTIAESKKNVSCL